MQQAISFQQFGDLTAYVEQQQCERHDLEVGAFSMTYQVLKRGQSPCGVCFCLHGPRRVKLTAIWETDRGRLLFYDVHGQRWSEAQLARAPRLQDLAP